MLDNPGCITWLNFVKDSLFNLGLGKLWQFPMEAPEISQGCRKIIFWQYKLDNIWRSTSVGRLTSFFLEFKNHLL